MQLMTIVRRMTRKAKSGQFKGVVDFDPNRHPKSGRKGHRIADAIALQSESVRASLGLAKVVASGLGFILIGFLEVLIMFLQAYVFTLLTAVYIGGALADEH